MDHQHCCVFSEMSNLFTARCLFLQYVPVCIFVIWCHSLNYLRALSSELKVDCEELKTEQGRMY